jgi:hypothetical protein
VAHTSSPGRSAWAPCIALVLLATLFRVYLLATTYGYLDADQAITGIMAAHIQAGDRPVFFYGQPYQGSAESYAVAVTSTMFGLTPWTVRLPALLCSVAFVGAVYWLGTLLYGIRNGIVSGLYLALGPPILIVTTISGGFGYIQVMLCGTLLFILALRYPDPRAMPFMVALGCGLLAGFGLWTQPLMLEYLLPWIASTLLRLWADRHASTHWPLRALARSVAGIIIGGIVGAGPLLVYNVRHSWETMRYLHVHAPGGNHLATAEHLVTQSMPVLVGLLSPTAVPQRFVQMIAAHPLRHLFGIVLGLVVLVSLARALIDIVVRRTHSSVPPAPRGVPASADMLIIFAICCILFFVGSNFGAAPSSTIMPRYLVPLYTVMPVVVRGLAGPWTLLGQRAGLALGVCALIVACMASSTTPTLPSSSPTAVAGAAPSPPPIDGLLRLLAVHKVHVVYASYWLAYRVTYESSARMLGIPIRATLRLGQVRMPQDLKVAASFPSSALAWVFDQGSGDDRAFRQVLGRQHIQAARLRWTTLDIYVGLTRPVRAPVQLSATR